MHVHDIPQGCTHGVVIAHLTTRTICCECYTVLNLGEHVAAMRIANHLTMCTQVDTNKQKRGLFNRSVYVVADAGILRTLHDSISSAVLDRSKVVVLSLQHLQTHIAMVELSGQAFAILCLLLRKSICALLPACACGPVTTWPEHD